VINKKQIKVEKFDYQNKFIEMLKSDDVYNEIEEERK
jgi:hypothetical protein